MNLTGGLWIATAVLHVTVVWVTVPRPQTWFRRLALLMWLCSVGLAAAGYAWSALAAQLLSMSLVIAAWHHRTAWIAAGNRAGERTYK